MNTHISLRPRRSAVSTLGFLLAAMACSDGFAPQSVDFNPPALPSGDPFEGARRQPLNTPGVTIFSGELLDSGHLETWDLGAIAAGSRVTVDVSGHGNNLSVGLFDEQHQVLLLNHDRRGGPDPYGVLDVSVDIESLFLVVSSDPTRASYGSYTLRVTLQDDLVIPEAQSQAVVLNFDGGHNVFIGSVAQGTVPAFDAAQMDAAWTGLTADMKRVVMDHLLRIYEGLDVQFYFAGDPDIPARSSTVHFGGSHARNVGLAANVDYGNQFKEQSAIVYTQNFAKYIAYGFSHEDIARGFANVAAHELGHLLGLNHTDLPEDVMNVSPTVRALMAPQYFMESAALDTRVFMTGRQDGAARIYATVGGDWDVVAQAREDNASSYAQALPEDFGNGQPADLTRLSSGLSCNRAGHQH